MIYRFQKRIAIQLVSIVFTGDKNAFSLALLSTMFPSLYILQVPLPEFLYLPTELFVSICTIILLVINLPTGS
jgi:hypothetical protein